MRFLPLILAFFVVACGTPTPIQPVKVSPARLAQMQQIVADESRNPSTAQFRNLTTYRIANGDDVLCGEINGQNGFGGFTGFKPLYARIRGTELKRLFADTDGFTATAACQDAASGTINVGD